jgi:hypothetical protein
MSDMSLRHRSILSFVAVAALAACSDSTGNLKPTSIVPDASVAAEGTAGTVLAIPPTFIVKDQNGNALSGVNVTVAITAGGGTLTEPATVSKDGPTPVGTWRLGNIAGVNTITVTVGSLTPLTINVTGKPGAPANIVFVSGANQRVAAGTAVVSPVAQVRDQFGNAVPGIAVTFNVIDGEGTLGTNNTITTDASGNATSPQWTLGKSAVTQSMRAAAGSITGLVIASVASDYDIDLRIFGPPMPPVALQMFQAAAARIKGAVTGDVPDFAPLQPVNLESGCNVPGLPTAFFDPVDDVIIYASVGPIDGVNQILAFSFPCLVRGPGPAERRPIVGIMKFDSDDLDNMIARGNLTDVIQHEMLHVVGIGTIWNCTTCLGLLQGAGTNSTRYIGAMGVGGCVSMGGSPVCPGSVPVENTGGPGTADAHWRETTFFNELMTGFVNSRISVPVGIMNPLSVMSIQSLADVGYTVNPKAADSYNIPGIAAARVSGQLNVEATQPLWEVIEHPRLEVSSKGTVKSVILQ